MALVAINVWELCEHPESFLEASGTNLNAYWAHVGSIWGYFANLFGAAAARLQKCSMPNVNRSFSLAMGRLLYTSLAFFRSVCLCYCHVTAAFTVI